MFGEAVAGDEAARGSGIVEAGGVQDHATGRNHDGGPAVQRLPLERREVRPHVQRTAVDGSLCGGIEDHEVGVEAFNDGAFLGSALMRAGPAEKTSTKSSTEPPDSVTKAVKATGIRVSTPGRP